MTNTTIKPILKYPGAKWALSKWLHQYTPVVDRVVDVYGGSGAFCLTLPYTPKYLVYNDLHDELRNLFQVLRNPITRQQLCDAVTFTLWSRAEYYSCVDKSGRTILTGNAVEDARRYLVNSWQAQKTGGNYRNGWRNMGSQAETVGASTWALWKQLPDRIRILAEMLQCMEVESMPALTLIGRHNNPNTLIYADPPYVPSTRKAKLYRHEMTLEEHADLLAALEAHPGPVMLSGYDNALYQDRLSHWSKKTIETRAEGTGKRVECLWLNPQCVARLSVNQMELAL